MASATPDLRLPSQPQNITAQWSVPIYTAWWTEAQVCEQLAQGRSWSGAAGTRTCDLSVASPIPSPLGHHATRCFTWYITFVLCMTLHEVDKLRDKNAPFYCDNLYTLYSATRNHIYNKYTSIQTCNCAMGKSIYKINQFLTDWLKSTKPTKPHTHTHTHRMAMIDTVNKYLLLYTRGAHHIAGGCMSPQTDRVWPAWFCQKCVNFGTKVAIVLLVVQMCYSWVKKVQVQRFA